MSGEGLDAALFAAWLRGWAAELTAHETELTELDAAIGDGDHGLNMARGATRLTDLADEAASDRGLAGLAKSAGMTLISSVGGAAGPLYGTFWLRFSAAVAEEAGEPGGLAARGDTAPATRDGQGARAGLDVPGLAAAFDAGARGLAERGRAGEGDKTMVDALAPAARALTDAGAAGDTMAQAAGRAALAARAGADATRPLIARRGRASYLGPRSAGHLDPGAVSAALLVTALADATAQREQPPASGSPGAETKAAGIAANAAGPAPRDVSASASDTPAHDERADASGPAAGAGA